MNFLRRTIGLGLCFGLIIGSKIAHAEPSSPSLKISGYTLFNVYGTDQKNKKNGKGHGYHFTQNDTNLFFTITGESAANFIYKYQLVLESIPAAAEFTQNFIELQYGVTIQLGAVSGFERSGVQDASRLMTGSGGFSGMLDQVYNFSAGVLTGIRPIGDTKYCTKVVIWSPEWEPLGLRLVLGFTPNTSHRGDASLNTFYVKDDVKKPGNSKGIYPNDKKAIPYGVNSVVTGLALHREIAEDWDVKLSVAGIFDQSYINPSYTSGIRQSVRGTSTYQVGGIVGYGKFQVGAGFLDNGRSRLPRDGSLKISSISLGDTWKGNSGKVWNVGGAWINGAYQVGIGYQRTDRKTDAINKANSDITSATFSVTPLQGLQLYAEANLVSTRTNPAAVALAQAFLDAPNQAVGNNRAVVGLAGLKLSF